MWLNMGDSEKVSHDIQGTKTINSPNLYHENTNLLPKFPNSQIPVHSCFKLIHKQNFTRKKERKKVQDHQRRSQTSDLILQKPPVILPKLSSLHLHRIGSSSSHRPSNPHHHQPYLLQNPCKQHQMPSTHFTTTISEDL